MRKHTPGPWRYDPKRPAIVADVAPPWWEPVEGFEEDAPTITEVAYLRGALGGYDPRADAQLMAAAPDLLEALRGLQRKLWEIAERHGDRTCDVDVCPEVRHACAAIAKAHGDSSAKGETK